MGSYVLMGDGIRPEIHASKRPKIRSSGKLPAGTTFIIGEPIHVAMTEGWEDRLRMALTKQGFK